MSDTKFEIGVILFFILSIFLASCSGGVVGNKNVPYPFKKVDIDKYSGKWYEIARYENSFEKDCFAVTAEYKRDGDRLKVINSCHKDAIDGPLEVSEGKAKIVKNSDNTKLKVSFFGPFYVGDYWIIEHDVDYNWSIVGEPTGKYLWLLARKPILEELELNDLVHVIETLGYDTKLLHFTPQQSID